MEALDPGETTTFTYVVIPHEIPCDWDIDVFLEVDDQVIENPICPCMDDVHLIVRGGVYPCDDASEWFYPGNPSGTGEAFVGETERVPVEPNCCDWMRECRTCGPSCPTGDVGYDGMMKVKGRIFAVESLPHSGESYLARLRLRVWSAMRVELPEGIAVVAEPLAETRLDDEGRFDLCVPYKESIMLEVQSTDEILCDPVYAARSVPDRQDKDDVYQAFSDPVDVPEAGEMCGLNYVIDFQDQVVEEWLPEGESVWHAAAFWPASMIAYEMRDFMQANWGVDIATIDAYRAYMEYPGNAWCGSCGGGGTGS